MMSSLPSDRLATGQLRFLGVMLCIWLLPGAVHAAVKVELVIDLRAEIAAGRFIAGRDQIGVRGQTAPLSWERSLMASPTTRAGVYLAAVNFDSTPSDGQRLEYKFKIERPEQANDGWERGRNRGIVALEGTRRIERAFDAWESGPDLFVLHRTGHIDRISPLPSKFVAGREVQVWLPPGYEQAPERRYPVLYMLDGETSFDAQVVGEELGVDETAQRLVETGAVEPMIVVAVESSERREEQLTPVSQSIDGQTVGGGAARYADYLIKELKPLIDQRYRTRGGRADTAIGGISLSGLMAMWLLLEHPETYGAGLVISPSAWWGDEAIVKQAARRPEPSVAAPRIWLDVGTKEPEDMTEGTRHLRDALVSRGWAPTYLDAAGAGHDFGSWSARMEPMLRFLYGAPTTRR
jgi:predicted alpha/beta superfamily hydrolase